MEDLGYYPILEFKTFPSIVYFNPKLSTTLSVIRFNTQVVVKAAKHFFIRGMETKGETGIYSKLQEITKFMEYLKHDIEDWHLQTYYISDITPRIALNNFRHEPLLQKYLAEFEQASQTLGNASEAEEQVMREKLERLKEAGTHDRVVAEMDRTLALRRTLRQQLAKPQSELKGAAGILNEWVEKGHAVALVWTISTAFHVCQTNELKDAVSQLERQLQKTWSESVKAKAYQQGLWLEEIREPQYVMHAEYTGLFHPSIQQIYKDQPLLSSLAREMEQFFNARLVRPIERKAGYSEESSTAVGEAFAASLRQLQELEEAPVKLQSKIAYETIKTPVYLGLIALAREEGLESTDLPFIVELNALTRHVLVTGTSGSGKTRIGQLITEAATLRVPIVILDPAGEFTGLIHPNPKAQTEREFRLQKGRSYSPVIYTLDDSGLQFQANLLKKPDATGDRLASEAEDTARVLSELVKEDRLRDIFRETLIEGWQRGDLSFESFMTGCRSKAAQRKIAIKFDRLTPYKPLMSASNFDVQALIENRLTVFTLNSTQFSDSEKLMFMWLILRELSNYFLNQPHSDSLRLLVVVDEAHRFYSEETVKNPSKVLENLNKEGRGKGLGMVIITQTIKDLPEILTQADTRILLKIAEAEIGTYGLRFGADLARKLHLLGPREGYVFLGSEQFFCRFRPTLSNPKGALTTEELRKYSAPLKALQKATEALTGPENGTQESQKPARSDVVPTQLGPTDQEKTAIEFLRTRWPRPVSVSELMRGLEIKGREKITNLVNSLEAKRLVKTKPFANKRLICQPEDDLPQKH